MPAWGADVSDQIVFDSTQSGNRDTQTATLAGVDKESVEVLALFLEIVGWQCVVVQSTSAVAINSSQLLIIDDDMFRRDLLPQLIQYRGDLPIALIGKSPKAAPPEPRFHYLTTPLNVKEIERIIEQI